MAEEEASDDPPECEEGETLILYLNRTEVEDVENIRPEVLKYVIEKAEEALPRYQKLFDYYKGNHDIMKGRKAPKDVKVVVNYAKYVVKTIQGYYLGDPVKYDVNDTRKNGSITGAGDVDGVELATEETIDLSPVTDAYHRQQISTVDTRIGKGMGIYGEALELCYASTDDQPTPKSAYIAPQSGVLVCDTTVEHNKLFAVVWDKLERMNHQKYYAVTVYTKDTIRHYECESLAQAAFYPVGEVEQHWFGSVPIIAYENNDERQGDFEQIIPLIDAYNGLMSNRFTDKAKFVDALLAFFGIILSDDDQKVIADEKCIDGLPLDSKIEYIQKTFDEASVQVLADAAVREMHKQTLTVDMSDENFSGNSSGQALKLKLLTMQLLVKEKCQQMEKGLKERLALYINWLTTNQQMEPVPVTEVDVVFTLATPTNEQEQIAMVRDLQGIVDDETLLSQLWFIKDPKEAVENAREQQREKSESYLQTFGAAAPHSDEEDDQQ